MQNKLAIVIPAYKNNYFDKTLASIAKQTCKNFTLYIGDDCSPNGLSQIVSRFENEINLEYIKFDNNIGAQDLVKQWERCIDMVKDEEWIWLFCDDDLMDPDCVENFFKTIVVSPDYDLYHFDVLKVNEKEDIIYPCTSFPKVLSTDNFLLMRLKGNTNSFVSEYIFRKSFFFKNNRFQNFDLAWCSDDATWIKLGSRNGIKTIENSKVYWRVSPFNISTKKENEILKRKIEAQFLFAKWILEEGANYKINNTGNFLKNSIEEWFYLFIKANVYFLPFKTIIQVYKKYQDLLGKKLLYFSISEFFLLKVYRSLLFKRR